MVSDYERVFRVGRMLLDCACGWLANTANGCPDRKGVVPGEAVAFENCCEHGGQLTVNVVTIFPSRDFPAPATVADNCNAPYEVVIYNIGILRCSPVGDVNRVPSPSALEDAAQRTLSDMVAIRDGVRCCLDDEETVNTVIGSGGYYRWGFGDHLTVGPEGGCAGSTLQVNVGLPTCWSCP